MRRRFSGYFLDRIPRHAGTQFEKHDGPGVDIQVTEQIKVVLMPGKAHLIGLLELIRTRQALAGIPMIRPRFLPPPYQQVVFLQDTIYTGRAQKGHILIDHAAAHLPVIQLGISF